MIALGWAQCGILKVWEFQIQIEAVTINFEQPHFGEPCNLVEDQNVEVNVLHYSLHMNVLNALSYCVSNLSTSYEIGLLDLNQSLKLENHMPYFDELKYNATKNCK